LGQQTPTLAKEERDDLHIPRRNRCSSPHQRRRNDRRRASQATIGPMEASSNLPRPQGARPTTCRGRPVRMSYRRRWRQLHHYTPNHQALGRRSARTTCSIPPLPMGRPFEPQPDGPTSRRSTAFGNSLNEDRADGQPRRDLRWRPPQNSMTGATIRSGRDEQVVRLLLSQPTT
jgi:hypothetical protein